MKSFAEPSSRHLTIFCPSHENVVGMHVVHWKSPGAQTNWRDAQSSTVTHAVPEEVLSQRSTAPVQRCSPTLQIAVRGWGESSQRSPRSKQP
jgi:hypothetical protein